MFIGLFDLMAHNDELKDRIAMAEEELQAVMRGRNTSNFEIQDLTTADMGEHDDGHSRDRWHKELEARASEDHQQEYATATELWNKGTPEAAVKQNAQWGDAEVFAEAVMHHVPEGHQFFDCLETCLTGTPYQVFAEWFVHSSDYDPNGVLDQDALCTAARAFLTASETLSATAVNVGASPSRQYAEGEASIPHPTPGLSRSNVNSRSHDLIDYIQTKPGPTPREHTKPAKVLVHVTVEIGDGRSGTIDVHEGDTAEDLAAEFVARHGLSTTVTEPLAAHVESSIDAVRPKLHSPKKMPKSDLAHPNRASPRTLQPNRSQNSSEWVARMSRPLKGPRACMDPSKSMVPPPNSLYQQNDTPSWGLSPRVQGLGMTPQSSSATQMYIDSREHHTGLDERGAQLSARMRSKSKASMAVSARLYKDAAQRSQKLKNAQQAKEAEEKVKLEAEAKQERRKWGGSPNKPSGPSVRYTMGDDGEQKPVDVYLHLYQEASKMQQKRQADIDAHVKKLEEKEQEVLKKSKLKSWGIPRISKKAQQSERAGGEVWERICDWDGQQRKQHLQDMRKEQVNAEMEGCTFDIAASIQQNPETGYGGRSMKLVNSMVAQAGHEAAPNRFEALYQDAKQRQHRVEQYQNWYPEDHTFNPDIGPDRYKPRVDETDAEFVDRLTYCKQDKMRSVQAPPLVDQNTGQQLFVPKTGRGPMTERNPSGLPIGDYLHACSYDIAEIRAEKEDQRNQIVAKLADQSKTTSNSHAIMENVRQQQLFEIFSAIDTDSDGIIDANAALQAAQHRLPAEIANDICPLVINSGQQHDFRSFYALCHEQVSSALVGPKGYLVPERERHLRSLDEYMISKDPATHTQKSLSHRSAALAKQRRQHRSGSLYQSLTEEREVWDERRRNMSEKKAAEELSACTFQPNVERVGARPKMSNEVAHRLVKPHMPTHAY